MKTNTIIILIAFLTAFSLLGLSEMVGKYKEKKQSIEVKNSNLNTLDSASNACH
jgi:hypothetical protein